MQHLFEVIFEDEELLVINKPAGLVCHPTKGDVYSSLISRARIHLDDLSEPQLLNRLDRETSGVVVIGKTPLASREVRRLWEHGKVDKRYFAIVWGHLRESPGVLDGPLGKDELSQVAIKDTVRADGAAARTEYELLGVFATAEGEFSLLEVRPLTGRKHQIRIHLAHHGHPIVGDKLYGGDESVYLDFVRGQMTEAQRRTMRLSNHALHAHQISFQTSNRRLNFVAAPEPCFVEFLDSPNAVALASRLSLRGDSSSETQRF